MRLKWQVRAAAVARRATQAPPASRPLIAVVVLHETTATPLGEHAAARTAPNVAVTSLPPTPAEG